MWNLYRLSQFGGAGASVSSVPDPFWSARDDPLARRYDRAVATPTLRVRRDSDDAKDLMIHLQRELGDDVQVTAQGLSPDAKDPILEGTPITVRFIDGRSREDADRRVREALDAWDRDWASVVDFE